MKKVLWLAAIFTLLFASHTFAAYTFSVKPDATTINATLSGITNTDQYKLIIQDADFSTAAYSGSVDANAYLTDATVKKAVLTGTNKTTSVSWSITKAAGTTYYVRAVDISPTPISKPSKYVTSTSVVTTGTVNIPILPITTAKQDSSIVVSGKLDVSKITNFNPATYTAYLFYTDTVPPSGATTMPTNSIGPLQSSKDDATLGINADGTYHWTLNIPPLTPSTTYYFQQVVYEANTNPKFDSIGHFDSSSGNVVNSAASQATYDASHGYKLLSGFPNFTFLPDPDLCAQQRASGLNPQFCDMNDVINYALKLMIGLAAVSLVFRIMYEGFSYMTSDIPFRVASAKSSLITAMLGLLLALTSFIILNTINPKLVNNNNTNSLTQLSIGVTAPDEDGTAQLSDTAQPTTGTAGACTAGITTVTVQKSKFVACSTYKGIPIATNLKNMLTAAYAAGIQLGGGGFRTSAAQTKLRIAHCNGDTTTPNAKCSPPTAPVGHSNHESGLAFDFECNGSGKSLTSGDTCFKWLQANAATYGLKNFAKEAWHWSWDGR
jgi:hypothetical protein